jgi:16S rRNA (cytosine1402-N4)-methyltransferase
MSDARHIPVLMREVVDALQPRDGGRYVDGTFGAGGYTTAMLDRADCQVIAIDRDPDAIGAGRALAERYAPRLRLIEGRFGDMADLLSAEGVDDVDGVALDLGVSSMQFDQADRGFSFRASGPLDMRMEKNGPSAADLVNDADEAELADIIFRYGEERRSRRVARAIVEARKTKRIETTSELAEIVRRAVGPQGRDESDPATRTFQALRIAVNDELGELERGLAAAEQVLAPGGRLAVVSFHSLEDRAVKEFVRARAGRTPGPSRHAPPRADAEAAKLRDLTRKPVLPSAAEIAANPRRSPMNRGPAHDPSRTRVLVDSRGRHRDRSVHREVQGGGPRGEDRPHQPEDRREPAGHAHPAGRMGSPQRGRAHREARHQASQARAGIDQAGRAARFPETSSRFTAPATRSTTPFPPTNGQRRPLVELARWWSRRSGGRQPLAGLRTPSRAYDRTLDAPSTGQNPRAGNSGSGWRRPERRSLHR